MNSSLALEMTSQEWDAKYLERETPWDTGRVSSELMQVVHEQRVRPGNALELGCGTGANSVFLATNGFQVVAVDSSVTAIDRAIARADAAKARARFRWADALELPADLDHPYDFVFDRRCYECLREHHRDQYLAAVDRITQVGSCFLLLVKSRESDRDWFHKEQVGDELSGMLKNEIVEDFGPRFEFSWIRQFRFDGSDRQPRHCGWSCLMTRR